MRQLLGCSFTVRISALNNNVITSYVRTTVTKNKVFRYLHVSSRCHCTLIAIARDL